MQTIRFLMIFPLCACVVLVNGCGSEMEDCKVKSRLQLERIDRLETDKNTADAQLAKCQRQLDTADNTCNTKQEILQQKIAALEGDMAVKRSLISRMQEQLLGGAPLPVELSTMLEDFAAKNAMVTYDPSRGIVKFESDLLFELGSDKVEAAATGAVKALCEILNSEQGIGFDIIVAGHTDDIDRFTPATRAKHPNNWYLSAHRAISVQKVMAENNIAAERTSIRGFSEYRPIAPNEPGRKGNPKNRRVEIYIVPKGT